MVDFVAKKDDQDFVSPSIQAGDEDARQRYLGQGPSYTGNQSLSAAFELGSEGISDSLIRMYGMSKTKDFAEQNPFPKKSVEDLNKQYPNLPNPFTEPTDPFVAGEIARRQTEKMDLQRAVELGPQDPAYKIGRFGAGMLAGSLDPFFAGAAIATGGLAEAALGGKVAAGAAKGLLRVATEGALQGAGSSLIAEPFKAAADNQENQPYSFKQGIGRVAEGALSFAVLNSAHAIVHRLLSPEQVKMMDTVAKNQLANDKIPDVSALEKDFAMEKSGYVDPKSGVVNSYKFNKLDDPNNMHFFVPKDSVQLSAKDGMHIPIGEDVGAGGMYMTDNPHVANGYAAPKTQAVPGSIHEVSFEGKNIEKLDELASPKFLDAARASIEDQGLKSNADLRTGKAILDEVKSEIYNSENTYGEANSKYNDFLKKLEFESKIRNLDGYHFEVDKTGSVEHEPYNSIYLFDKDVTEHGVGQANPDSIYKPDLKEAHDLLDKTLKPFDGTIFHDPKAQSRFDAAISSEAVKEPDLAAIEADVKSQVESVKRQVEQFKDLPGGQELLDHFKEIDSDAGESENILRQAFDCFLSKGVG